MHKTVDIYDPENDSWSVGPAMNDIHTGHVAAVVGNRIVVAGGEMIANNTPAIIKSVEIYDPGTGKWTFAKDMPVPVHGAASVSLGGKMYVIGGSIKPYSPDFATANHGRTYVYEPPAATTPVLRASTLRGDVLSGPAAAVRMPRLYWKMSGSQNFRVDALGIQRLEKEQ